MNGIFFIISEAPENWDELMKNEFVHVRFVFVICLCARNVNGIVFGLKIRLMFCQLLLKTSGDYYIVESFLSILLL